MIRIKETEMEDQERIAKLETKVESIQEDVKELRGDMKDLHSRITTQTREIVDKIDDFQTRIEHKMAAAAVAANDQHNSIKDDVLKEMKDMKTTLDTDIQEVTKRVDILEQWRWMIVGGAIVFGYIVGHMGLFSKIFG
jgi:septation ring formation regulator EzrA